MTSFSLQGWVIQIEPFDKCVIEIVVEPNALQAQVLRLEDALAVKLNNHFPHNLEELHLDGQRGYRNICHFRYRLRTKMKIKILYLNQS